MAIQLRRKLSVASILLFACNALQAYSTCYSDRDYPATADLQPTEGGYRVVLSGKYRGNADTTPVLAYSAKAGWSLAGRVPCKDGKCVRETQGCAIRLPPIVLSTKEAEHILFRRAGEQEQTVSACIEHGKFIYFGLSSYKGEGGDGVGGIGRYNRRTGKMEIHRPRELHEINVTHIAHDGKFLWVATANQSECDGLLPAAGLLRYDWHAKAVDSQDARNGMCGFTVRGLLAMPGKLVVASDTGVSVRTPGPYAEYLPTWRHVVPDLMAPGLMRETKCVDLHEQMLLTVSQEDDGMGWSSFEQLVEALARTGMHTLLKYVRAGVNQRIASDLKKSTTPP